MRPASLSFAALACAACGAALLAVFALPPAAGQAAPEAAGFGADFRDRVLRIDYFHVVGGKEEWITLDRMKEEGPWPGSRTHLLDEFDNGAYYVKLFDAATGRLLYSRGFDSYAGEYRTTGEAEKGIRRTYHETARVPFPLHKARFAVEVRQRDKTLRELFEAEIDPASYTILREPLVAGVTLVEAQRSGDPHAKVDVAIVGEGYTAAEQALFRQDLARYTEVLLGFEPYRSMRELFNVWGVFAPSQDSGCDEPSRGIYKNTAVGATFDSLGSERYLLTEDNEKLHDIAAHAPYDIVFVMVNQERYGGGGIYNFFCTFTTRNQWSEYVFLHEFGHAFAGLADEYYTSSTAYNEFYPRGIEPNEPNITALLDPAQLKWRELVTPKTPVPTPWEKAGFDEMDRKYQKIREEMNRKIAERSRAQAPAAEIDALKAESERMSLEHAQKVDAYLAQSKFAGQVGAFEGAGYSSEGLYRSSLDCMMFTKGRKPFCAACRRAIERVARQYTE
ncbi:MAG: peptidase M64 [Acidobacteria bacterium]|nr:peptidase M64 [Acidobacteriota bacterium]